MPWRWRDDDPTNWIVGTDSLRRSTRGRRENPAFLLGLALRAAYGGQMAFGESVQWIRLAHGAPGFMEPGLG